MSRTHTQILMIGIAYAVLSGAAASAADSTTIPNFSSDGIGWRVAGNVDNTGLAEVPEDPGNGYISHHPDWPYAQNVVNRVGDFTNPNLTPWAAGVLEGRARKVMAGGIPFIPNSRCWPGGVPGMHFFPASVFYLQNEDQVWILNNRGEVRRVFMNVPHREDPGYSWYGESIGHYEGGDTLVIDTIGQDDKGPIDRYNTPHTRQLHVVERHALDAERMNVRVVATMVDPGAFKVPLKGMINYGRSTVRGSPEPAKWEEYVCNENSDEYFIPEEELVPVPSATRRDF
jgi:hypothetical protein